MSQRLNVTLPAAERFVTAAEMVLVTFAEHITIGKALRSDRRTGGYLVVGDSSGGSTLLAIAIGSVGNSTNQITTLADAQDKAQSLGNAPVDTITSRQLGFMPGAVRAKEHIFSVAGFADDDLDEVFAAYVAEAVLELPGGEARRLMRRQGNRYVLALETLPQFIKRGDLI